MSRLVKNCPGNDIRCAKLTAECDALLFRLGAAYNNRVHSSKIGNAEHAENRNSLPPSSFVSGSANSPTNRGAIPKSTQQTNVQPKKISHRRKHVTEHSNNIPFRSVPSWGSSHKSPSPVRSFDFPPRPSLNGSARPFISRSINQLNYPPQDTANEYDDVLSDEDTDFLPHPRYVNNSVRPTKYMDTWKVKFESSSGDVAMDEFVFRVESIARSTNTSFECLAAGLHFLLSGRATSWYWIHIRKYPNQGWTALKRSLIAHFSVEQIDAEIRVLIEAR